jgi:plasmid stabilization system protein ParE
MMAKRLTLTPEQRKKLGDLWYVYGNNGPRHTQGNHKWIQTILRLQMDHREMYKPSEVCIQTVDEVLKTEEIKSEPEKN